MGRKESNQTNKNLANLGEPNEVHKHNQSILHKQQCLLLPSQYFGWKIKKYMMCMAAWTQKSSTKESYKAKSHKTKVEAFTAHGRNV